MNILSYFSAENSTNQQKKSQLVPEIGLVAIVISVIAMMIIPLPVLIVDLLVAVNMMTGILVLLTVLYIKEPLDFTSFPSVLLISTLFRLSLSIATTRLILGNGEAGEIITTFGALVAGGNLVVGLVAYLIIVVVQFVVIAKGAERVAEVAARFTLDAMPGKQLSIDSDLRAGLVDKEDARRRRHELELESKLHGSLDGAMKFVKGDAIASIIIVITNLIAGFIIGVLQRNMTASDAMQHYSLLSIGEGLVGQIPALLSAMAAGMLVTRGASDARDHNLGASVARQLVANPRVLLFAGAITLMMAAVPGFPWLVFVLLAGVLGLGGVWSSSSLRPKLEGAIERFAPVRALTGFGRRESPPRTLTMVPSALPPVLPLLLELRLPIANKGHAEAVRSCIAGRIEALQFGLGISLPPIAIHFVPLNGHRCDWRLLAFEAPIGAGDIDFDGAADQDYVAVDLADAIVRVLRRHVTLFIGIQETTDLLNQTGADYPEVVKEAVRNVSIASIAEVLRNLVSEGLSIRHFRDVLEAIADIATRETDPGPLSDLVRVALKRYLLAQYAPEGVLNALAAAPALEAMLRDTLINRDTDGPQAIALDPEQARRIISIIADDAAATGSAVLLVSFDIRRALRQLIAADLPDLPVLAFNELAPTLKLRMNGHVQLPPQSLPAPLDTALADTDMTSDYR